MAVMATLAAIALGGAVGAVSRYSLSKFVLRLLPSTMPWGTFVVNALGCLLMGVLMAHAVKLSAYPVLQAGLTTGLLGALTTFSTFSLEVVLLIERRAYAAAGLYVLGSVVIGILAVLAGGALVRAIAR